MHHCLYISEIVSRVCTEISLGSHAPKALGEKGFCLGDVARLARTCRAFRDPALDILWHYADGSEAASGEMLAIISPLRAFHRLEQLHVTLPLAVDLDDASVRVIAASWPRLRVLDLLARPAWRHHSRGISLTPFSDLLLSCTEVRELSIVVDFGGGQILPQPTGRPPDTGHSPVGDVPGAAAFLSAVCPNSPDAPFSTLFPLSPLSPQAARAELAAATRAELAAAARAELAAAAAGRKQSWVGAWRVDDEGHGETEDGDREVSMREVQRRLRALR
ncbi:hypothetical protein PLICRDRAFT_177792 [Plicaturopsis crispa FD-325 SS-3]|nr:hypothetical protein PLICRDRAFT_177792 [Plicaturopsis crispa FD-325 SS-3]